METEEMLRNAKDQQVEWKAWQDLIDEFCRTFKMTREELNKRDAELKPFFKSIEHWGDELAILRVKQKLNGSYDVLSEEVRL